MHLAKLSLIARLDSFLTNCLCVLISWLVSASIWILGLLSLLDLASRIFAYGEGWADLSWAELAFMMIFALLLWRHFRYCRYFAISVLKGMRRLIFFQGILAGGGLAVAGFITGVEQQLGTSLDLPAIAIDPVTELAQFGLTLLALYLAAPVRNVSGSRSPSFPHVEPAFTTAEKDVTA
ncbi:hypothetical protein ACIPO9_08660 [Pseudomonas sp. NPDC090203]|jgi:hypothetical protein|uniref:hypothetical protein n=1 Tax=Pseudomonas sp. NPDC090203 TaxID=3364477 RepID=UPI0037FC57D4